MVSPKATGKFEIACQVSGYNSNKAKHSLSAGPNTFVTDCSVPIWVTSVFPSIPIQASDTQLPRPPATGLTSGTFHSPVTQPNAWPGGACTTVPDQVGLVYVPPGRSRARRSMPGTSSGTGVNSG